MKWGQLFIWKMLQLQESSSAVFCVLALMPYGDVDDEKWWKPRKHWQGKKRHDQSSNSVCVEAVTTSIALLFTVAAHTTLYRVCNFKKSLFCTTPWYLISQFSFGRQWAQNEYALEGPKTCPYVGFPAAAAKKAQQSQAGVLHKYLLKYYVNALQMFLVWMETLDFFQISREIWKWGCSVSSVFLLKNFLTYFYWQVECITVENS